MNRLFLNVALFTWATALVISCGHDFDVYQGLDPETLPTPAVANNFDFSTTRQVTVSVDYSANAFGAVYFEIFDENPYTVEAIGDAAPQQDENVKPIYGGYTNANGTFSKQLTLPAYVEKLYVVSGNALVGAPMLVAEVKGNSALARLDSSVSVSARRAAVTNYAQADGEKGSDVPENLYTYNGEQVTAPWVTPLGSYDQHTGRPDYILSGSELSEAERKGLVFTSSEMDGLFEAVGNSVSVDKACPDYLRVDYDLELARPSELVLTLVGSFTGWNNSLGYYIYEGDAPTDLSQVQVIMVFPNTQDGCWWKSDGKGGVQVERKDVDYHGAIALNRGDAVRLYYYPNHTKDNFSTEGATEIFPQGAKVGFVLKNNGWGAKGTNYAVRQNGGQVHNWWATSTAGLSKCLDDKRYNGTGPRTCKFKYSDFVVLGFEDYGDDENYSDLSFAIRPAEAFQALPVLESKQTEQRMGVYGFEDLWPAKGDYDMNDVLVDYKYIKSEEKFSNESAYKTKSEVYSFTTYQNYAALHSGLAVKVNFVTKPESIVVSKGKNGNFQTVSTQPTADNVYVLTEDINVEIGSEYRITANYPNGVTAQSPVQVFIFRPTENGKQLEVHLPFEAPTDKVDMSFFTTQDDLSNPSSNKWYVRAGNYPFAFFLAGGDIESFKGTLLNREYESQPIDDIYPKFIDWSVSKGASNADWYK